MNYKLHILNILPVPMYETLYTQRFLNENLHRRLGRDSNPLPLNPLSLPDDLANIL